MLPLSVFMQIIHAFTFITHDCDLHACPGQHAQAFSLAAVLHVAEVKARHEDPEPQVGHPAEELAQPDGAVDAGRPGAEPGDGVAQPLVSDASNSPPQTGAQRFDVAQKQQLKCKNKRGPKKMRRVDLSTFHLLVRSGVVPVSSPRRGSRCDCGGVQSRRSKCPDRLSSSPQSTGRFHVGPWPSARSCSGR